MCARPSCAAIIAVVAFVVAVGMVVVMAKRNHSLIIDTKLKTQSIIALGMQEDQARHPIKTLVFHFPTYCVDPGANLVRNGAIAPLVTKAKVFHPPKSRNRFELLEALKGYWAELSWTQHPCQFKRGATWFEFTMDFIAATTCGT